MLSTVHICSFKKREEMPLARVKTYLPKVTNTPRIWMVRFCIQTEIKVLTLFI